MREIFGDDLERYVGGGSEIEGSVMRSSRSVLKPMKWYLVIAWGHAEFEIQKFRNSPMQ